MWLNVANVLFKATKNTFMNLDMSSAPWKQLGGGGVETTVYLISAKQGCKLNYLFPLTELEDTTLQGSQ